jgi:YrbI family 3-deoxy-D-manno-octulosonate 8-phosphate phosphatase
MRAGQVAAVILARGGSKGIPGKNLRRIGGLSLLARSVRAARAAVGVAGVWVSTDDPAIAAEARAHGAQVIDRPAALATDSASSEAGWLHALPVIRAALPGLTRLVLLQCTSPFTTGADIDLALAQLVETGADCALSVVPDHGFLWQDGPDGFGHGTNHDETQQRQRRQDLPPQWLENGAIYVVDAVRFEAVGRRFCGRVALVPVDHPGVEIDTLADLDLVAALLAQRGDGPSPTTLARVHAVVMDFDGVHTDDLVHTDQNGIETVTASRSDGLGLGRLRDAGRVRLLILSKERNPVVTARAAKLQIEVLQGIDDKAAALGVWLDQAGTRWQDVLYVGNDINDQAVMRLVGQAGGLSACPSDAHPAVLVQADWVLPKPGGRGALRVLCDAVLAAGVEAG